jgi:hypothetical protein
MICLRAGLRAVELLTGKTEREVAYHFTPIVEARKVDAFSLNTPAVHEFQSQAGCFGASKPKKGNAQPCRAMVPARSEVGWCSLNFN